MGPTRKSRSVNRRYANETSPSREDSAKSNSSKKRKLYDLLGPRWTLDELTHFYDAYRKYGREWKKVSAAVRNRSSEMVEALYTMNRAYLSLPHGTASAAGLVAMVTDHYSNMAGSDSDHKTDDAVGSSRKTHKHSRGKHHLATSKASDDHVSHYQSVSSNYGCLPLLTKKRPRGTRPCHVRKRTPRFPVSFPTEYNSEERKFSPTKTGLQLKSNANDDEVAHEIAIALAEASQKGGSPMISQAMCNRGESAISSPFWRAQKKYSLAEAANAKYLNSDTDEKDLEGSTMADAGESSGGAMRQRRKKLQGIQYEVNNNGETQLGDTKEECSGTDEGQRLNANRSELDVEVNNDKIPRSFMQGQRKKSKKCLSKKEENLAFDALQTLADLSLMMPSENEDDLRTHVKDEEDCRGESVALEPLSNYQQKERRRYSGVRMKGQPPSESQISSGKATKPGKGAAFNATIVPEENANSTKSMTKARKYQKTQVSKSKIHKSEVQPDIHLNQSPAVETTDAGKKSTQGGSPDIMKNSGNSASGDLKKEGSDSAQSAVQVPAVKEFSLTPKVRNKRKMILQKPQALNDLKIHSKNFNDRGNLPMVSLSERALALKEKLSSCLSNPHLRRWCIYEWFYSAIDYPWFSQREFVEYLCHVGLGHVSKLTRAEWGVIRSSLGKPRRFSKQFLMEEMEKLTQYRDSVRKHYSDLREGVREGLPTDLARPLSVGQRVIAIHPKTGDIHDGSILTVDHSRCHVQFDHHELGVEFIKDIDCMPLNPFENMPTLFGRQTIPINKVFENELKANVQNQEFLNLHPGDNVDGGDGVSQLLPFTASPARPLKQAKVVSENTDVQARIESAEFVNYYQQAPYSQPSAVAQIQAKEADVQALAKLTRALDKKEAVFWELRRMNNEVSESQKDGDSSLKDYEPFRKQYAAVLVQLGEINEQVSHALYCLRQRNTYPGNAMLSWPQTITTLADPGGELSSLDHSTCQIRESDSQASEIIDSSRARAQAMVDAAIQALSSLKSRKDTNGKSTETIDYLNDRLPSEDGVTARLTVIPSEKKLTNASNVEAQIPSELISKCVATLLMIQKCAEHQFPPSDMAQILDSALTDLQPKSSQNLQVYNEIQKCMGIIKNQIMARIPA